MTRQRRDAEFGSYVAEHRDRLLRLAFLLCGDWSRAEDVVQVSLSKLYVGWHRVEGSPHAYARQIVSRSAVDEHRRPWRREVPTPDHLLPQRPDVVGDDSEPPGLAAALLALPPRQRQVVVLRYFQQLTVQETAEALGISTGTVKSTSSKALARLGRLLRPTEQDGIRP